MRLLEEIIKNIRSDLYKEIKKEALYVLDEFAGANDKALKDNIFRLIEEEKKVDLLRFPIEDDDLCGFICQHRGQTFIYINTYLPYEKQIFAAAHELYHLHNNGKRELLHRITLEEKAEINLGESKANLFAALLLVPDSSLEEELKLLKVNKASNLDLLKIIKLMDTFAVPYKTIILRLYELELINEEETKEWLAISDRNPKEGVLYHINKHQIGIKWQRRTREVKYSNLKALILDNDLAELLPKKRIEKDLGFIGDKNER
ncbi:ImmA/IrrE family metallo-endopeptidase [Selenihalanaerobacter shriftii]|uniref:Zn-dependent peptidase ImmA, M78 family n=1 Tax=Selenihalanaerobacter shriftii TaxID=142842 RepID=A0A1T4QII7_9FIRM|nr:ImmA/IrrE family metallo-endopeptidase [Selenihalanaerobacter shriftii]SKA03535.1 Zn-dependent peptidase ImmA, M78 family [Selenihalanaerobacter shriftii]